MQDYEQKLKEMNQSVEKSKIETERMNVEVLLQERLKILEAEKAKKKREYEIKEKQELQKKDAVKKTQDVVHKSEKLEQTLHNVVRKLNKLKIVCGEFRRNVTLEIFLAKQNLLDISNESKIENTQILIKVENYEEGTVYYWNTETFYNRYDMMKELFEKYQDEDIDPVVILK